MLRYAAYIALAEAFTILVLAIYNFAGALNGDKFNVGLLIGLELLLLLGVASLVWIAWGLNRRKARARIPFVLFQLFALVFAYPLIGHGGWTLWPGIVLAVMAFAGIVLVFNPRGNAEFDSE